jgi:hypothetical protein
MAIGDAAVAAGMQLVIGSTDLVRDGYTEHNRTRDYIAQRTSAVQPVAKGGTGATNPGAARANLGAAAASHTHHWSQVVFGGANLDVGPTGYLQAGAGMRSYGVRYLTITNGPATMACAADGVFGIAPSARRFKQDIQDWQPTPAQLAGILAIRHRLFRYTAEVERAGEEARLEHGVIAEELLELGLDWLVVFDDAGATLSVHYDKLALALLVVLQDQERRLARLEQLAGLTNEES